VHHFAALRTPPAVASNGDAAASPAPASSNGNGGAHVLELPSLDLMEVERRVIEQALALTKGNRTRAAHMLGINVRTLRRKLNGGRDEGDDEVRGRVA
jgi:DNA-binding NtrC family response regulator